MKMEKLVCSAELAQKLYELGCTQDSAFHWFDSNDGWVLIADKNGFHGSFDTYAAFTAVEALELLPKEIKFKADEESSYFCELQIHRTEENWWVSYGFIGYVYHEEFDSPNLASAAVRMIIHLVENKLMEVPE